MYARYIKACTVNLEKFGVKVFTLVQPTTKIKLMNIFSSVNFRFENNTCNVNTKMAVLNALLLTQFTASPYSQCQSVQADGL